jgi:arylsulfatase
MLRSEPVSIFLSFNLSLQLRLVFLVAFALLSGSCRPETRETVHRFIDHVDGSKKTFTRAELPSLRDTGHRSAHVTLHGETRAALTDRSSTFSVDVPETGVLRFAIAVGTLTSPRFRTPVAFTVSAGDDVLFEESIERAERNRWHDREVDLSRWSGSNVELALTADVSPEEEALFPLWAYPVLSPADDSPELPKFILVSIDCLRADHVGAYGYHRDTTPSVDAFAENAVVFETAIATSATTLPTHTGMFTGFTPSEHGASNRNMLAESVAYLPEILGSAGFRVDGVVSGAYLAQNFGFERGFHSYLSLQRPRAEVTVDAALEVLDRARGQAHFLFLHLIDAHWPYDPPEAYAERFGPVRNGVAEVQKKVLEQIPPDDPVEVEQAIDLYDAEIAYADRELGRFFDELQRRGLYDDALIIVTGDHGEAFQEHDSWQHGWTLYDEIVHVPLIVKWPGSQKGTRTAAQVSQTDIFATLLREAGIDPPHGRSRDLAELVRGAEGRPFVISEFTSNPKPGELPTKHVAIRTDDKKYIATFRTDNEEEISIVEFVREELYDLEADPGETKDLASKSPDDIEAFRKGLNAYLDEARAFRNWRQGDAVVEDEAILERLRALGYLQ